MRGSRDGAKEIGDDLLLFAGRATRLKMRCASDLSQDDSVGLVVICERRPPRVVYGVQNLVLVRASQPRGKELQLDGGYDEGLHSPEMVNGEPDDAAGFAQVELSVNTLEARALHSGVRDAGCVRADLATQEGVNRRQSLAAAQLLAYLCHGGVYDHTLSRYQREPWP